MVEKIDIKRFCDFQGVSDTDRKVLEKNYKNSETKSYEDWFKTVSLFFPHYELRDNFKSSNVVTSVTTDSKKNKK